MRVHLGQINGLLIFGFLPTTALFLPAVSFYLLLLGLFFINRQYSNILGFLIALTLSFLVVEFSLNKESLSLQQYFNSLNFCVALFLIPLVLLELHYNYLSVSSITSAFMLAVGFFGGLLLLIDEHTFKGIVQILAFNFAAYFCLADKTRRRLYVFVYLIMSGARAVFSGLLFAYIVGRFKFARSLVSLPVFLSALLLLGSGVAALKLNELLLGLQADQIALKGRTGIWLALLQTSPGWFGNGVGYALLETEAAVSYFQLPHSDWLRIWVDFGILGVIATLVCLFVISRKSGSALVMSIVLGVYMLVGNPLSFPTVIVTYFFVCQTRSFRNMRTS